MTQALERLLHKMKKHYYAVFKQSGNTIEVEFPDLPGCATFGKDWEEALVYAEDVLAAWLANADLQFIKDSSTYEELKHLGELVPILVDPVIGDSYQSAESG